LWAGKLKVDTKNGGHDRHMAAAYFEQNPLNGLYPLESSNDPAL